MDREVNGDERIAGVLAYWFGDEPDDGVVARAKAGLWWGKNPDSDREVRERFGELVHKAATGMLRRWLESPRGQLALIIVCDQFTRMIYRDTQRAFATDRWARIWCEDGLSRGTDRALRPIERVFFYLPLEHSEELADQERAVSLFTELRDEVPDPHREAFDAFFDYAVRHRDVIARFGRFPHRNRVLGRQSTQAEIEFLREPGSAF